MAKPEKKKARDLTTDEALERIFGKKAADRLREIASELPARKSKKKKGKKKDDG
jgi:hypothetical protein